MRSDGSEISAESVTPGERLLRTRLPPAPGRTKLTAQFSRLLGLLAAEGSVTSEEHPVVTFRNNEKRLLDDVQKLWEQVAGGTVADFPGVSGFTGEPTGGLRLNGSPTFASYLRTILYTKQSQKRVPHIVLNSDEAAWRAFLSGYNEGDGLRAGHGRREFKNFKTSSPTLGAGLWWMASITLPQKLTLNVDFVRRGPLQDQLYWYYSINLGSDAVRAKTSHLARLSDEVKLVAPDRYIGWVYDIATASGTFHAGIGDLVIHNSPRRGHEFVTRKISDAVAKISLGRAKTVRLGTLTTRRDWGYAPEYCDFMYRVLQAPRADDFVGATGETHSVEEFVTEAFRCVGITDWKPHVVMDPKFARPAEVDTLLGNARKSKEQLGWEPKVRFLELVKIMVENDLQLIRATPSV
ncbi:MAG: GDP-mannose 4,6-dehydratase [Thermoplasmata archaeon]|nr:GDP-mannose 4,6-dehydratase [Thermoplasmata archaeon]